MEAQGFSDTLKTMHNIKLLHDLYLRTVRVVTFTLLKPTHALISKHTFTFTFIKTLKLVKMFCKKRH
jgi:hypothetical protein